MRRIGAIGLLACLLAGRGPQAGGAGTASVRLSGENQDSGRQGAAAAEVAGEAEHSVASPRLVYVRRATREATIDASLEASRVADIDSPWYYIGPFDNSEGRGFDRVFPPEVEVDLERPLRGVGNELIRWRQGTFEDGRVNSLLDLFPVNQHVCCYLYRRIEVAEATSISVSLGSDDAMKLWLNGRELLAENVHRPAAPDQARVALDLEAGENELLLKVCNDDGLWGFYFRPALPNLLEMELQNRLEVDFPTTPEARHYRIVSLPVPDDIVLEVGGLGFLPDGSLLACTRRGEVWRIENALSEDLTRVRYSLYAAWLHEALGLEVEGNEVFVVQRPELTQLLDLDGDYRADVFRTICDAWGVSGDYHEFAFGPARGPDGNFYVTLNVGFQGGHQSKAPWRGWCMQITPEGDMRPWCAGLRSPNGVNFSPDGGLFYCDNQGEWVASCKLAELREGDFHGHPASLRWHPEAAERDVPNGVRYDADPPPHVRDPGATPIVPPAVWFPYGSMSQSASEPVWDTTGGAFGPFAGQCFVGDQTRSNIMRVYLEEVGGRHQGACFFFRSGFQCGVNRLEFVAPPAGGEAGPGQDVQGSGTGVSGGGASLMVGMTDRGWGSTGGKPYGLQRLVYTGVEPFEILEMRVTPEGWDLVFTQPVDREAAGSPESYSLESYTYLYHSTYGSPEIDRRPERIVGVRVSEDGRMVSLVVPDRRTGRVYELNAPGVRNAAAEPLLHAEAFYTLNRVPVERGG